ncbi:MAG: bifunctional adenosylcobinamide kinase/adenosylcobinamide-phosphate guanylyltransferase [Cyanobacteria bacterium P01_D01_bin.1]
MSITLVTGPSRSGKSEWAEQLAANCAERNSQQVVYVATAKISPDDAEWRSRIKQHQLRRPTTWQVEEVPTALEGAILLQRERIDTFSSPCASHCLLIDSLGTWLANLIEQDDDSWQEIQQSLVNALMQTDADVILVAEETGWGVVPAYQLGRRFRDRLGTLSRTIGQISTDVYLVASGYAINLKQLGTPVGQ